MNYGSLPESERASVWILCLLTGVLLSLVGCAGGSSHDSSPDSSPTLAGESTQPEVDTDKIERVLDQKMKDRFKPSENSPGPIMVSFYSLPDKSARVGRKSTPARGRRSTGKQQKKQFIYMVLISKEWAYKKLPVREIFSRIANPGVKVINDRAMNWFLKFLKKNNFHKFPRQGKMSLKESQKLSRGEIVITLWNGTDSYKRVYFDRELKQQLWNMLATSPEKARSMFKDRNNIIFGFQALYNKAPKQHASVRVSRFSWTKHLKQLGHKHRLQNTTNVQGMLRRAELRIEQGQLDEAEKLLKEVLEISAGTTYYHRAIALMQDLNEKRSDKTNRKE